MCLCLYVFSNKELQVIPLEPEEPTFSLERVTELALLNSLKKIRNSIYIYLAGAFEGCSCGFFYLDPGSLKESSPEDYDVLFSYPYDIERHNKANQSIRMLFDYLKNNASESNSIAIYYCWEGDEVLEPHDNSLLNLEDNLLVGSFEFPERHLLLIET